MGIPGIFLTHALSRERVTRCDEESIQQSAIQTGEPNNHGCQGNHPSNTVLATLNPSLPMHFDAKYSHTTTGKGAPEVISCLLNPSEYRHRP